MSRTVHGKSYIWQVSDLPIGSGDAGEVYAVSCKEQPELIGVMKTPTRIATGGTIQRQAGQIAQEALALVRLDGLPQCKAHPPRLLDSAIDMTLGTANYFIISEPAPGENLSSMLAEKRQTGKPFPRRVIITVLDALFDLFARAHHAGVLWNDVKLEHIYWHSPTGEVAVIDWGNAVFLNENMNNQQLTLPRWGDYRQLVDSLGNFLQQNAPELYNDLGWDEFQNQTLDSPRVSVLARRIAYQQQVIALKVLEYQALIRVVLDSSPTLEGLQKIQSYQQILEQIGAPWNVDAVLDYSRSLVLNLLEENTSRSVKATTIIWDMHGQSLTLPWHLLREYFRYTDLLSHASLHDLVKYTLYQNWPHALWTLLTIAQNKEPSDWWQKLMPVLRQKALNVTTPTPHQSCLSLLKCAEKQGVREQNLVEELTTILDHWRLKGIDLQENPFDYALLYILDDQISLPSRLRSEIKQSFAAGQEATRSLLKAWVKVSWDEISTSLRVLASWDPDRWGIIYLDNALEDFRKWMTHLYEGPGTKNDIQSFLQEMLTNRPPVDHLLGSPPWLKKLLQTLNDAEHGAELSHHKPEIQTWCPWLLEYP